MTVGPHANWTGAAGSGASAPIDPVRTTAKAIGRFLDFPMQRISSAFTLKVLADAFGGVAYVEFSGDCATTRVSTPTIVSGTNINGVGIIDYCYAITLDHTAFLAKSPSGNAVNVYARIVANNGSVQDRVIGGPISSSGAGLEPMVLYPEATAHDYACTVASSGADFTTLKAAIAACRTAIGGAQAQSPLITITQTGSYEAEDSTSTPIIQTGGRGWLTITHAAGVTATISRASAFNPTNQASWNWTPGWDGIEFRGSGLAIDRKNFTQVLTTAGTGRPFCFNGCKITNSIGTRDTLYWSKNPPPIFSINSPSYFIDTVIEYGNCVTPFAHSCIRVQQSSVCGDQYSGALMVYGCTDQNNNGSYFTAAHQAMTVQYTSTGPATIQKWGGNGGGGLILVDPVNGTTNISIGAIDNPITVEQVVAAIRAVPGWTASSASLDTTRAARYLIGSGFGDTNGFPATDATIQRTLSTLIDIHADWYQFFSGVENLIVWRNVQTGLSNNFSQTYRTDGQAWDVSTRNNCWFIQQSSNFQFGGPTTGGPGNAAQWHWLFADNTSTVPMAMRASAGDNATSYIARSIFYAMGADNGSSYPAAGSGMPVFDCCAGHGAALTSSNSSNYIGNFSGILNAIPDWTQLFQNPDSGDYTPKGILLGNLKPGGFACDQRVKLRSASEPVGAWRLSA